MQEIQPIIPMALWIGEQMGERRIEKREQQPQQQNGPNSHLIQCGSPMREIGGSRSMQRISADAENTDGMLSIRGKSQQAAFPVDAHSGIVDQFRAELVGARGRARGGCLASCIPKAPTPIPTDTYAPALPWSRLRVGGVAGKLAPVPPPSMERQRTQTNRRGASPDARRVACV